MKELTKIKLKKETEGVPGGAHGVISFEYSDGVYDVRFPSKSLILTKDEIDEIE